MQNKLIFLISYFITIFWSDSLVLAKDPAPTPIHHYIGANATAHPQCEGYLGNQFKREFKDKTNQEIYDFLLKTQPSYINTVTLHMAKEAALLSKYHALQSATYGTPLAALQELVVYKWVHIQLDLAPPTLWVKSIADLIERHSRNMKPSLNDQETTDLHHMVALLQPDAEISIEFLNTIPKVIMIDYFEQIPIALGRARRIAFRGSEFNEMMGYIQSETQRMMSEFTRNTE